MHTTTITTVSYNCRVDSVDPIRLIIKYSESQELFDISTVKSPATCCLKVIIHTERKKWMMIFPVPIKSQKRSNPRNP